MAEKKSLEERIESTKNFLKENLNTVRAGRANPALLDKVMVDYYGNEANIGINPANDGKVIRLAIPQLTEERRKELTKVVKGYGEDAKVAVRNMRRDMNEELKKSQKAGEITEDDLKEDLDETQKTCDKAIKDIDDMIADKEKELMEV